MRKLLRKSIAVLTALIMVSSSFVQFSVLAIENTNTDTSPNAIPYWFVDDGTAGLEAFLLPQSEDTLTDFMTPFTTSFGDVTPFSTASNRAVDLVFVIDVSGSMAPYIGRVRESIAVFSAYLEHAGMDLRMAVVEYSDIVYDGMDSTTVHRTARHTVWHNSIDELVTTLSSIRLLSGGDIPETPIDGLGFLVDGTTIEWRSDAMRFAFLLTDASAKAANRHGFTDMRDIADALAARNIYTSVVTHPRYRDVDFIRYYPIGGFREYGYLELLRQTGGMFFDISAPDYEDDMIEFASRILELAGTRGRSAIYIIPGYLGSRLFLDGGAGTEIWVGPRIALDILNPFGSPLRNNASGIGMQADAGSTRRGDRNFDEFGTFDTYRDLVVALRNAFDVNYGGTGEFDVIFFPYNWLGDLHTATDNLERHINHNGYRHVTFVAHSTGGLLVANYIARGSNNRMVDQVFLIGAPMYGTLASLEPIEIGMPRDFRKYFNIAQGLGWLVSPGIPVTAWALEAYLNSYVRSVTNNSPTTYQLLPSNELLRRYPMTTSHWEWRWDWLRSGYHRVEGRYSTARGMYSVLNNSRFTSRTNTNLTDGNTRSHRHFRETSLQNNVVNILRTVGNNNVFLISNPGGSHGGIMTPTWAEYARPLINLPGGTNLNLRHTRDGDGTVTGYSATLGFNSVFNQIFFPGVGHTELVESRPVLNRIIAEIRGGYSPATAFAEFDAFSTNYGLGMSDMLRIDIAAPYPIGIEIYRNVFPYTIAASLTEDNYFGFDGIRFLYGSRIDDITIGTNAFIYMPNGGYNIRMLLPDESQMNSTNNYLNFFVSPLTTEGFRSAVGSYGIDVTAVENTLFAHIGEYSMGATLLENMEMNDNYEYAEADEPHVFDDVTPNTANSYGDSHVIEGLGAEESDSIAEGNSYGDKEEPDAASHISLYISEVMPFNTTISIEYLVLDVGNGIGRTSIPPLVSNCGNVEIDADIANFNVDWELDVDSLTLANVGSSGTIGVSGSSASVLDWISSDENVVTVIDGVVTATGHGFATVYAAAADFSGKIEAVNITVTLPPASVSFNDMNLLIGERQLIMPVFHSPLVTETNIHYDFDSTGIIEEYNGVILGVRAGTVEVTGTTENGLSDTFIVTVVDDTVIAVSSISVTPSTSSMTVGSSATLTAEIAPSNATNTLVSWAVDDLDVLSLTPGAGQAEITALSEGVATVTLWSIDGGHIATATVTVTPPAAIPPTAPPTEGQGGGGGGQIIPSQPAVPRVTIFANNGAVDVPVRIANNRITLELPTSRVNQLVNTAVDNTIIFDLSGVENITTAVFPRAALSRFATEGFALRINAQHGIVEINAEALADLAGSARNAVSIDLKPVEAEDDAPPPYEPAVPPPAPDVLRFVIGSTTYTFNGMPRTIEAAPFIEAEVDRIMVPIRFIAEAMGANVNWIKETRTVTIDSGTASLRLTIDVPLPGGMGTPVIAGDRTFVPIRYVSETLGANVRWDENARAVYIYLS